MRSDAVASSGLHMTTLEDYDNLLIVVPDLKKYILKVILDMQFSRQL